MAIGDGSIKTFSLRGIKDSPPYMHNGRLLTLEDTVEFFNLILGTRLTREEKQDLDSCAHYKARVRTKDVQDSNKEVALAIADYLKSLPAIKNKVK
jgi:cytochrome c peroxidase